jgi:hypothetical protein
MIERLRIKNFRCFREHELSFVHETIMVGRNNAGKSTVIEALRYVSIVVNRLGALNFEEVPSWLDIPRRHRGVKPSLRGIDLNEKTLFYRYGDPPGIIEATLSDGIVVTIYFGGGEKVFAVVQNTSGHVICSKGKALKLTIPRMQILPQIGPLLKTERLLRPDYFRSLSTAPYQSTHFRNYIAYARNQFAEFQRMAADSWPGIKLGDFDAPQIESDGDISLLVRDGAFTAEIGWMGHGLQMWLQIMWFLVSASAIDTVILDEPDVYMHADLQRRLIRLLRNRYNQTIVATHSVEMLSEVSPDHVLIIDRQNRSSKYALSNPTVQKLVDQIGAVHNIQLTRLWAAKRLILVEGEDLDYLHRFQQILAPSAQESLKAIPNMSIGGWSGWPYVLGTQLLMQNSAGNEIQVYCLLDRDFHSEDEIQSRRNEAQVRGIDLHVWARKEIENYLLVPAAIHRAMNALKRRTDPIELDQVVQELDSIANRLKDHVFDSLSAEFLLMNKSAGVQAANRKAREVIDRAWASREGQITIIPGKRAFSMLAEWSQQTFGVSLSKSNVLQHMSRAEVPSEMISVIGKLSGVEES